MDNYIDHITSFFREHRRLPSYSEIMRLCGFKSKNSVYKLVQKMIDGGFLVKESTGKISPGEGLGGIRMAGFVQAGLPTPAEAIDLDRVSVDNFFETKGESFLLTVSGDSMIDAGIQEGDMVLVQKTNKAKEGDIVIAKMDDDWTMKYLRKDKQGFYLEAANKKYDLLRPEYSLEIGGVVKGVLRKY